MTDTRNFFQRTADEIVAGNDYVFEAKDIPELRNFQRQIHTYANIRGYRLTTQKVGMTLKVKRFREMLESELEKFHKYSPTHRKFRAGRQKSAAAKTRDCLS